MPKVSIIVPVYNVERYIVRSMDSLVNQTLKDIEIIVVNDGSTDNSKKLIGSISFRYTIKSIIKHIIHLECFSLFLLLDGST